MGGATAREARALLRSRGIAGYDTPGPAVAAVGYLTDWGRAQAALLRVPDRGDAEAAEATPENGRERVAALLAAVAAEGRRVLTAPEADAVLAAYGIPSPPLSVAATPEAVRDGGGGDARGRRARSRSSSCRATSATSPTSARVVLDVASAAAAEAAARAIAERVRAGRRGRGSTASCCSRWCGGRRRRS